jgi:1,4-dihydroxy-2-naphthoyl-CoA hydrolase
MPVIKDYYTVKLHDTDAAGILFFANQFKMVHDIYEKFMIQNGFPFQERFAKGDYLIPIVHAESDYHAPMVTGETVEIELAVERIGETSYTLRYIIYDLDGHIVGKAKTVHVTMDHKTRTKIPLPSPFRQMLEGYQKG